MLFEVMQGPDDGDPSAAPVPVRWPEEDDLKRIRIGYFEDDGRTPVTAETRAAVRSAAEGLQRAGFQVEPFRPEGLELARQLWWKIFGVAGGMLLGPMMQGHEAEISPLLEAIFRLDSGRTLTYRRILARYLGAARPGTHEVYSSRCGNILCCFVPSAAIPAFRHGERSWHVEGKTVQYLDAWSYTEWFNLLGMPAAVVPVGKSPEGLPIGVQIAARPWEEEIVLSVAAALEEQSRRLGAASNLVRLRVGAGLLLWS